MLLQIKYINILKNTSLWILGFIQGIKDFFNIWKLIKLIYYNNKLKMKNYVKILIEKALKIYYSFLKKNLIKLEYKRTYLNW